MTKRTIRKMPDPILRRMADPVLRMDDKILVLINDLIDTARDHQALGLAAPQIGASIAILVVLMYDPEVAKDRYRPFINPNILRRSGVLVPSSEGCLSLDPSVKREIPRPRKIQAQFEIGFNNPWRLARSGIELRGMEAVAFQHECDHLQGRLIIDYPLREVR